MKKNNSLLIIVFVAIFAPIFINLLILLSNYIHNRTGVNLSALGLNNAEWFSFWGTYFGGIATLIAVFVTVQKTEEHYIQTSKEQKRQNKASLEERQNNRRLDVLPLLILQPIEHKLIPNIFNISNSMKSDSGNRKSFIDEVSSSFHEFDISEIGLIFSSNNIFFRLQGPSEDEWNRVKNRGDESIFDESSGRYYIGPKKVTYLNSYWLINAGKEVAINITIDLFNCQTSDDISFNKTFSLMAKDRKKTYFLIDEMKENYSSICGKYLLIIEYYDIYSNHYRQEYQIHIGDDQYNSIFSISLNIENKLMKH
ncbi:MAG: hypothetical protein PWQ55_2450 [Chloroflexota bacterium]|nr:hypothetical protein [Chloroflexota bacterium]